jgi:hypothetical protein
VEYKEQQWSVYRRYNEFEKLHEGLRTELGDDQMLGLQLPEKTILSKIQSSVVKTRMINLEHYLRSAIVAWGSNAKVRDFLDMRYQGISGAVRDLGKAEVQCETLARAKPGLTFIEPWCTSFVVLSKKGTLYVMGGMYDGISKSMVTFLISGGHVHIESDVTYKDIYISNTETKQSVFLRFETQDKYAQWLRILSDLTIRYFDAGMNTQAAKVQSNSSGKTGTQAPPGDLVVDVKTPGTGNTNDALSTMYGI